MSVGGRIIEIRTMTVPETGEAYVRIWVVDQRASGTPGHNDETCVHAVPAESMPAVGDEIWWQSGRIYFDNDRQQLVKIGYSYSPEPEVDG